VIARHIGRCVIGDSSTTSVLDPYHRLWGHPGLTILAGSKAPANLGVNLALAINALAERATGPWPNQGVQSVRLRKPDMATEAPPALRRRLPVRTQGR
jgi:cholesterol oxidase